MDNCFEDAFFFYVPKRSVWDEWRAWSKQHKKQLLNEIRKNHAIHKLPKSVYIREEFCF